jgi:hypothetical protein
MTRGKVALVAVAALALAMCVGSRPDVPRWEYGQVVEGVIVSGEDAYSCAVSWQVGDDEILATGKGKGAGSEAYYDLLVKLGGSPRLPVRTGESFYDIALLLGQQGWELCAATKDEARSDEGSLWTTHYYFKRQR